MNLVWFRQLERLWRPSLGMYFLIVPAAAMFISAEGLFSMFSYYYYRHYYLSTHFCSLDCTVFLFAILVYHALLRQREAYVTSAYKITRYDITHHGVIMFLFASVFMSLSSGLRTWSVVISNVFGKSQPGAPQCPSGASISAQFRRIRLRILQTYPTIVSSPYTTYTTCPMRPVCP